MFKHTIKQVNILNLINLFEKLHVIHKLDDNIKNTLKRNKTKE